MPELGLPVFSPALPEMLLAAAAMALLNFDEQMNGPPFERPDPVSDREDAAMWETWAKLRERWPRER